MIYKILTLTIGLIVGHNTLELVTNDSSDALPCLSLPDLSSSTPLITEPITLDSSSIHTLSSSEQDSLNITNTSLSPQDTLYFYNKEGNLCTLQTLCPLHTVPSTTITTLLPLKNTEKMRNYLFIVGMILAFCPWYSFIIPCAIHHIYKNNIKGTIERNKNLAPDIPPIYQKELFIPPYTVSFCNFLCCKLFPCGYKVTTGIHYIELPYVKEINEALYDKIEDLEADVQSKKTSAEFMNSTIYLFLAPEKPTKKNVKQPYYLSILPSEEEKNIALETLQLQSFAKKYPEKAIIVTLK